MKLLHDRASRNQQIQEGRLRLEKRQQVLKELDYGIITKAKARKRLEALESSDVEPESEIEEIPVRPVKRSRLSDPSPTQWDCEDGDIPTESNL